MVRLNKKSFSNLASNDASKRKRGGRAGGPAAAGGMNFQAAVTAIAAVHIARGRPLNWLSGLVDDTPVSLWSETGGPGDDLRLVLRRGDKIEVQVKKGLKAGKELWDALTNLAFGIHKGEIAYGVLAVCPASSGPVATKLAEDIARLGEGRTDGLSVHGVNFHSKLTALGLTVERVCGRLRIRRIHALTYDDADVRAARTELERVLKDGEKAGEAWHALYNDACRLIEHRGARDASSILQLLQSIRLNLACDMTDTPTGLLAELTRWTKVTNSTFTIVGSRRALPIAEAWIELKAIQIDKFRGSDGTLQEALERYHSGDQRSRRDRSVADAETIGRFRGMSVVVAGPGMGKSTLTKRLALEYALDGFPALRVDLKSVATRMKETGIGFAAAVFEIGLDGAPVSAEQLRHAAIDNWVLLCDGLDETGPYQDKIAEGAANFAAAHPTARIIISTRPIGYRTAHLSYWRHYELAPLESSSTPAYVSRMLEHLLPEDEADKAYDLAHEALRPEEIKTLLARSPLLVSLAAALVARGSRLGRTKVELYTEIMKLLEDEPPRRLVAVDAPPKSIAQCFLYILGWSVQDQPPSRLEDICASCSRVLAEQLDCTLLAAEALVDRCLAYWEELGIVERVRHGGEETVTFVHKTFGEFAAAKHLVTLPEETRRTAIAGRVGIDAWSEVLNFGASLGASTEIAERALVRAESQSERAEAVALVLQLTAEADVCPRTEVRERAIAEAVQLIQSDRRTLAAQVGHALARAARKVPEEIAPRVTGLEDHFQSWTRLAAWTCLLAGGRKHYDLVGLRAALAELPKTIPMMETSLAGGLIIFDEGSERSLAEQFMLDAIEAVLTHLSAEADEVIPPALNGAEFASYRYLHSVHRLLAAHQKSYEVEAFTRLGKSALRLFEPDGWSESERAFCQAIFGPLALVSDQGKQPAIEPRRPLFHLGAFVAFACFWDRPAYDSARFCDHDDHDAVEAVMRAATVASGVPLDHLAADLAILLARLDDPSITNIFQAFRPVPAVDPPEEDWTRVNTANVSLSLVERALHHRSQYIVSLAANCLGALCTGDERRELVARVLEAGEDLSLAAAAYLTKALPATEATDLLLARLIKPLNNGSLYLFRQLESLSPPLDERLIGALQQALQFGPRTATAAARVAALHAQPGADAVYSLLAEAYDHWRKNEKPMPEGGGIVPESPRAEILKALLAIEPADVSTLVGHCGDRRSDVSEIGRQALTQLLRTSQQARAQFSEKASGKETSASLLRQLLQEKIPFAPGDVARLTPLLEDAEPKFRYAAISLLNTAYMSPDAITAHAQRLIGDPELEVREAAYRKLERR
jgi:hypothetical protein